MQFQNFLDKLPDNKKIKIGDLIQATLTPSKAVIHGKVLQISEAYLAIELQDISTIENSDMFKAMLQQYDGMLPQITVIPIDKIEILTKFTKYERRN